MCMLALRCTSVLHGWGTQLFGVLLKVRIKIVGPLVCALM